MCLEYPSDEMKQRLFGSKKYCYFYKVYQIKYGELWPIYYDKSCVKISRNGWIKSNRRSLKLDKDETKGRSIYKGIHVFCKKIYAENFYSTMYDEVVIKVIGFEKDCVGANEDQAVFTKIKLADLKTVKKMLKKYRNKNSLD